MVPRSAKASRGAGTRRRIRSVESGRRGSVDSTLACTWPTTAGWRPWSPTRGWLRVPPSAEDAGPSGSCSKGSGGRGGRWRRLTDRSLDGWSWCGVHEPGRIDDGRRPRSSQPTRTPTRTVAREHDEHGCQRDLGPAHRLGAARLDERAVTAGRVAPDVGGGRAVQQRLPAVHEALALLLDDLAVPRQGAADFVVLALDGPLRARSRDG